MLYKFCPGKENLAVIFNSDQGGFSTCAADILFPCLLLILAFIRILTIKPKCPSCLLPFKAAPSLPANNEPNVNSSPSKRDKKLENGGYGTINGEDVDAPPARMEDNKREPKCRSLNSFFVWLHLLMPVHSVTLLVVRVILGTQDFVWVWPVSILLIFTSWWIITFSLEVEISRAQDKNRHSRFRHNFLLFLFWLSAIVFESVPIIDLIANDWPYDLQGLENILEFSIWVVRLSSVLAIFALGCYAPGLPNKVRRKRMETDDEQGLFGEKNRLTSEDDSTFKNFYKKMKFLWPYIWPKNEPVLQLNVVLCFIILVLGRFANIFIPIFYSKVVEALSNNDLSSIPLGYIALYCCFYFLSGSGFGGSGFLSNIRSFLWINVQQYTMRTTMVEVFSHLHNLSLRWHLGRKTGEVLGVIDRGNNSVVTLLSYILFTILPTVADILIAIGYFIFAFNFYFGLIVFGCLSAYVAATVVISEWRTKFRREVNKLDNATRTKAVDSLINFETVKYYGAEKYEIDRYRNSLLGYQSMQWRNLASLQFLNLVQIIIVNIGLFAGCMLCAYYIVDHERSVGTFVLYTTYIVQLYGPLNFLGTWFRMIQQSFIDMENMLDLFMEKPEVTDSKDCTELYIKGGELAFDNVSFHYTSEKPILKNISFKVPAGQTVAIVGPSGSGKSTIIRLLFRFYDIQSGYITIDGVDISKVSQASLRKNIGVVPQDTVLFNDTIKYNIQYGRPMAEDKDIFEAAERADIHARIEQFPEQYETLVGERGLKLSGGEKQRVAIARTVLKAPKVILLDEATSALDTKTERNIQSALDDVSKDRTTLVVAHRLSTVVKADLIIVLKEGEIVERGTHQELLANEQSVYAEMWAQQATSFTNENENHED